MTTTKFCAVIGVNAGYGENCNKKMSTAVFGALYQAAAEKVFAQTGIYISATAHPAETLYSPAWGCPKGGEFVFALEGSRNPEFCKDEGAWKEAVIEVIKGLKKELQQSTVTVEFSHVEQVYLTA